MQAGFDKVNITPPLGTHMSGFGYRDKSKGCDRCHAEAGHIRSCNARGSSTSPRWNGITRERQSCRTHSLSRRRSNVREKSRRWRRSAGALRFGPVCSL